MDNLGVNFAPTADAALNGQRNGQLSGIPQAIQILSLALPHMAGVRAPAPSPLLNAPGGQGTDPTGSALLQTIMRALGLHSMGLPGGTAGPGPGMPPMAGPGPSAPMPMRDEPLPQAPSNTNYTPRVQFQPNAPSAPAPMAPRTPFDGGFMGSRGRMPGA